MKKLLITTLAMMSVLPLTLLGDDDIVREIDLYVVRIRISMEIPEASIQHDVLSVSFDASGMYTLYVEDSLGGTACTSALPATFPKWLNPLVYRS